MPIIAKKRSALMYPMDAEASAASTNDNLGLRFRLRTQSVMTAIEIRNAKRGSADRSLTMSAIPKLRLIGVKRRQLGPLPGPWSSEPTLQETPTKGRTMAISDLATLVLGIGV